MSVTLTLVEDEPGEAPDPPIVWTLCVPEAVERAWEHVRPILKRSVEWSDITAKLEGLDDVRSKLIAAHYTLWIATQGQRLIAAVVADVAQHSRNRVCNIHYGAGDEMEHWLQSFADEIIERARQAGCRFIRIEGRDGWGRALKSIGFKKAYTGFMLEI